MHQLHLLITTPLSYLSLAIYDPPLTWLHKYLFKFILVILIPYVSLQKVKFGEINKVIEECLLRGFLAHFPTPFVRQWFTDCKQLQIVAYFGSLDTLSGLLPLGKWLL